MNDHYYFFANRLFWISGKKLTYFSESANFHITTDHVLDTDTMLLIYKVSILLIVQFNLFYHTRHSYSLMKKFTCTSHIYNILLYLYEFRYTRIHTIYNIKHVKQNRGMTYFLYFLRWWNNIQIYFPKIHKLSTLPTIE